MYEGIEEHLSHGPWKIEVDMNLGNKKIRSYYVSSLSAFWPALQVLAGDIKSAQSSHGAFYSIWKKFQSMPEIFDIANQKTIGFGKDWPLRPELIESTYHLYVATRDPYYLQVAQDIMLTLNNITRVPCGFASIADVNTHRLDDRMDSYFLAETLKYLYLIFDEASRSVVTTAPFNSTSSTSSTSIKSMLPSGSKKSGSKKTGSKKSTQKSTASESNGASSISSSYCLAWRQTSDCNGGGPRELNLDQECTAVISSIVSGYCECGSVYNIQDSKKGGQSTITSKVNCGHAPFTCEEKCREAATESTESTDSTNTANTANNNGDAVDSSVSSSCNENNNEPDDIMERSCRDPTMVMSTKQDAYPLLDMERVVFTTEGHSFLLWPSLRSRPSRNDPKISTKSKRSKKVNKRRTSTRKKNSSGGRSRSSTTSTTSSSSKCPNVEVTQESVDNDSVERAQSTSDTLAKQRKAAKKKNNEQKAKKKFKKEQKTKNQKKKKKKTSKAASPTPKAAIPPTSSRIVDEPIVKEEHGDETVLSKSSDDEMDDTNDKDFDLNGLDGLDGLDALTDAIGVHISTTGLHQFSIECNYKGVCTLGAPSSTIGVSDIPNFDFIDVTMYIANDVENVVETVSKDEIFDRLFGKEDHQEEDSNTMNDDGVIPPLSEAESAAIHSVPHANLKNEEENNEDEESFQVLTSVPISSNNALTISDPDTKKDTTIFQMVASPALFGPPVPFASTSTTVSKSEQEEHDEEREAHESGESEDRMNDDEETMMEDSSPALLTVSINMIEGFFYGCQDPKDLDPTLKNSAFSNGTGFGMVVYRGQCSFVQKAKLAEWLGSSLVIVIDSDTEGYVLQPPKKTMSEQQFEKERVTLFFQQLRKGILPIELANIPLNGKEDAFSMADDGSAADIGISSIFLSKSSGLKLIKYLMISQSLDTSNTLETSATSDTSTTNTLDTSDTSDTSATSDTSTTSKPIAVKLFLDVNSRKPPTTVDSSTTVVNTNQKMEFSIKSLQHVGILPESIIHQISQGLSQGQVKDFADEVKTTENKFQESRSSRRKTDEETLGMP